MWCNKRVENSKDSVCCYVPTCNCSNSRPVELCALKSYHLCLSLHASGSVSPASGSASLCIICVESARLTRRARLHCLQLIAGRLLLISVLGPLLPAVGRRRLCCLFLKQFFRHCCGCCGVRRDHLSPASSRQAGQPCYGRRHGHPCVLTMRRRKGRQPRCWVAPEAKVCAGGFVNKVVNKVGRAVANPERIIAVRRSAFRDLSIGTLDYVGLSR